MNNRQRTILRALIEHFIDSGEPVSSGLLADTYDHWAVSSATIRNELMALTQEGFLEQPHTSAGRIPTAKGYRFFVDNFLHEPNINSEERQQLERMHSLAQLSEFLAQECRSLILSCEDPEQVYESGLSLLLDEPEFSDRTFLVDFIRRAEQLRGNFTHLMEAFEHEPHLYIGEESNRIGGNDHMSLLFTPLKEQGFVLFLSSTRMNYPKSLALANFLSSSYDR